jgi:hypothetical protein
MFENRHYVIFNTSELSTIDFSQVMESSADTVRKSVDESKTFVKWEGAAPACVEALETKGEYLTHEEILAELASEEWNPPRVAGLE